MNKNAYYPDFWQGVILLLAYFALLLVISLIFVLILMQLGRLELTLSDRKLYPFITLFGQFLIIPLILFINKKNNIKLTDRFKKTINVKQIGLILILGVAAVLVTFPLTNIKHYFLFFSDGYLSQKEVFEPQNHILDIIGFLAIAPVLEEYFFRGQILHQFLKRYSIKFSIITSSIFFAVIHLDFYHILGHMFFGVIAGIIYYKTHSLILVILLHSIVNSVVNLILLPNFDFFEPFLFFSSQYIVLYFFSLLILYYCLKYLDKIVT